MPTTLTSEPSTTTWQLRDYVSPGLRAVHPDAAFPHMRAGDALHHPWKYLRRDVPHIWYADERFPLMGFLNRDEATLLHNVALQFAGKRALEIGSWLGWSTAHLALAGVELDVIDPAHDDPVVRTSVEQSLAACGVASRVHLARGRSPETIAQLGKTWSLFFVDGDHETPGPLRDTIACLPYAAGDCAFVFHDLAAPDVADALRFLATKGFDVVVYQTAQIMAMAWRGGVTPVAHVPDPDVAWQLPMHLRGLPISGVDFVHPRRAHRRLRDVELRGEATTPSVCIVTNEINGPFKNGGIGTSMTGLALALAADGMPVTVFYSGAIWSPAVRIGEWTAWYAARGVELIAPSASDARSIAGPLKECGFAAPSIVYRFLRERHFDVIHFNDCCGEGSLALAAKRLGIAFADSLLVVALHSPSRWVLDLNGIVPDNSLLAAFDYAERLSVTSADVLWSPSEYLLDWIAERGFATPSQTFVQQYVIPREGPAPQIAYGDAPPAREIVFFGRLEERKGLRLFCNAIDALRDDLASRGIAVTFLGKAVQCGGVPSRQYLARRSAAWKFATNVVTDLGQPEALSYLRRDGVLAVMPSPVDNSPCTIYEVLACGIPFVATRSGGVPELIDERDRDAVLAEHTTESLRNALRHAIEHGGRIARPAVPQEESRRSWTAMHAHWRTFLQARDEPLSPPKSVAAIIDHVDGARIEATIDSLLRCPAVQRIMLVNRSNETFALDGIDVVTEERAETLTTIGEDAVLLIHSGVAVYADAFAAMLPALVVDGLLPAATMKHHLVPPLGGSAAFSFAEGATFTGALLLRREALVASPRSPRSAFFGLADAAIVWGGHSCPPPGADGARTGMSALHARGILPYPEPVIDCTRIYVAESKSAAPERVAAYGSASANDRYYMLANGRPATPSAPRIDTLRRAARVATDLGLGPLVRVAARARRSLLARMRMR